MIKHKIQSFFDDAGKHGDDINKFSIGNNLKADLIEKLSTEIYKFTGFGAYNIQIVRGGLCGTLAIEFHITLTSV